MKINKFNHQVAADAALSNQFSDYLFCKSNNDDQILSLVEESIQKLAAVGDVIVELFDEARAEYNSSVQSYKEKIHCVPNIQRNGSNSRTYLRFVWGKLKNKSYRLLAGNPSDFGFDEIDLPKNDFGYTYQELKTMLGHHQKAALPLILETEHAMRFVRIEYLRFKRIRKEITSEKNSRYQQLRIKEACNDELTKAEDEELRNMNVDLMFQINDFDPFKVPVKKSMFKWEKK